MEIFLLVILAYLANFSLLLFLIIMTMMLFFSKAPKLSNLIVRRQRCWNLSNNAEASGVPITLYDPAGVLRKKISCRAEMPRRGFYFIADCVMWMCDFWVKDKRVQPRPCREFKGLLMTYTVTLLVVTMHSDQSQRGISESELYL